MIKRLDLRFLINGSVHRRGEGVESGFIDTGSGTGLRLWILAGILTLMRIGEDAFVLVLFEG